MNARRLRVATATALMAALGLTACGGGAESPTTATDPASDAASGASTDEGATSGDDTPDDLIAVSFRADVYYTGKLLPVVAGIQTGIYEQHGLDVTINGGTGSGTTTQTVGNGSDDLGYADAGVMTQFAAQGLPVKMVAGDVQISPLAILYRTSSGIESPQDLEGLTSGFTPGSSAESLWPAFVEATGIDDSTITLNNVDIPTRGSLFVSEETDFTFGLDDVSHPLYEERCECDLEVFRYADYDINVLSSGFITSTSFLESNPEAVRRFLAATAEAKEWTANNVEEALDAFYELDPESNLSRAVLQAQYEGSREKAHTENTQGEPWGCMAPADWESTISSMEEYAGVEAGAVTPGDVATNDHLPEPCSEELA